MFFRWLQNRRDRQRGIFRFWDGSHWRAADPLAVFRALDEHPALVQDLHYRQADDQNPQAIGIVADAVRLAFGVKKIEDGGLTELECRNLLIDFYAWTDALKKNIKAPPINASHTAPPPWPTTNGTDTNFKSDCGSTDTGPKCDTPTASPAASATP